MGSNNNINIINNNNNSNIINMNSNNNTNCNNNNNQTSRPISKLAMLVRKRRSLFERFCCHVCKGYIIDATTVNECMHTFCRSCIVKHFQRDNTCPQCPSNNNIGYNDWKKALRRDKTTQDLVYKTIPGLYDNEMARRREYYKDKLRDYYDNTDEPSYEGLNEWFKLSYPTLDGEQYGIMPYPKPFYHPEDSIEISIEPYIIDYNDSNIYYDNRRKSIVTSFIGQHDNDYQSNEFSLVDSSQFKTYLECPAKFTVFQLKKFITGKFNACKDDTIRVLYLNETLFDDSTLMDIAYVYDLAQVECIKLYYSIQRNVTSSSIQDYHDLDLPNTCQSTSTSNSTSTSTSSQSTSTSSPSLTEPLDHQHHQKQDEKRQRELTKATNGTSKGKNKPEYQVAALVTECGITIVRRLQNTDGTPMTTSSLMKQNQKFMTNSRYSTNDNEESGYDKDRKRNFDSNSNTNEYATNTTTSSSNNSSIHSNNNSISSSNKYRNNTNNSNSNYNNINNNNHVISNNRNHYSRNDYSIKHDHHNNISKSNSSQDNNHNNNNNLSSAIKGTQSQVGEVAPRSISTSSVPNHSHNNHRQQQHNSNDHHNQDHRVSNSGHCGLNRNSGSASSTTNTSSTASNCNKTTRANNQSPNTSYTSSQHKTNPTTNDYNQYLPRPIPKTKPVYRQLADPTKIKSATSRKHHTANPFVIRPGILRRD